MVHLLYGGPAGLTPTGQKRLGQSGLAEVDPTNAADTITLLGGNEPNDFLGASLASRDFNKDGYADLVIGAPGEGIGANDDAGMVHLLYGGPAGLTPTGQKRLGQSGLAEVDPTNAADTITLLGGNEPNGFLGASLASGDFNKDGYADLVIGAPGEGIGANDDAGMVDLLYGGPAGLTPTGQKRLGQSGLAEVDPTNAADTITLLGGNEPNDFLGASLASGDFNKDGYADLVIGAPGEGIGANDDAGMVHLLYGGPAGLTPTGQKRLGQSGLAEVDPTNAADTITLLGGNEPNDFLGASLASGDFNKDGYADLVIGAPGEGIGANDDAGMVHLLYGGPAGLTPTGQKRLGQSGLAEVDPTNAADTITLLGGNEPNDFLGGSPRHLLF